MQNCSNFCSTENFVTGGFKVVERRAKEWDSEGEIKLGRKVDRERAR